MKEEKEFLGNTAIAALALLTIAVELVLTWTLIVLNALPSIIRGYWFVTWLFFGVWILLSVAWIGGMYRFISKRKRKRFIKAIKEVID